MACLLALFSGGCIFDGGGGDGGGKDNGPSVTSLSIKSGDVYSSSDLEVSWTGSSNAGEYQYVIDGEESSWSDISLAELTGLGEGLHEFIVRARQDTLVGRDRTVSFEIDAVQGPGIVFSPRFVRTMSYVTLYLEDVESLMTAHIELNASEESAQLFNFEPASTVYDDGRLVVISDGSVNGRLVLDIGFPGVLEGVGGRVEIGTFIVRSLLDSGTITIDSENSAFRDINNEAIEIIGFDSIRVSK